MAASGLTRPLIATAAPMIVMSMNNMVMNNALPSIGFDFSASLGTTKWVIVSYTFVFATLMLVATSIGDRLGQRRVFLAGIAVFIGGSVGCALAPTLALLVVARATQAVGAAAVLPLSLVLLISAIPQYRRNVALSWWGGANGLAIALGPLVGGTVTGEIGWRWVFWINVAAGGLSLLLGVSVLQDREVSRAKLDVPGMVGVTALVVLLMAAISEAGKGGVTAAIVAGIGILVPVFVWWERRASSPVLPIRLCRNRSLLLTYAVSVTMFFAIMGTTVLCSQYLQFTQGYSPLHAGLASLPSTATPMLAAPLAGMLLGRIGGGRLMTVGLVLIASGLAWMAITTTAQLDYLRWAPGLFLAGTGLGIEMTAANAVLLTAVPAEDRASASAMNNTVIELGAALGVFVLVGVFQRASASTYVSASDFVAAMRPTVLVGAAAAVLGAVAAAILAVRYDPTRAGREARLRATLGTEGLDRSDLFGDVPTDRADRGWDHRTGA